jgi:hypothetical protein
MTGYESIPRIIHMVWLGSKPPKWVINNVDQFKRLNEGAGYSVHLHTEPFLLPGYQKHYDSLKGNKREWSAKSDLVRVSILKDSGGWYVDTDFWPLVPIDVICEKNPMAGNKMLVFAPGRDHNTGERLLVSNGFIACAKDCPALMTVIEEINPMLGPDPAWGDYGTRSFWNAEKKKPEQFHVLDMDKTIPIKTKIEAIEASRSSATCSALIRKGVYAIHFNMQDSMVIEDAQAIKRPLAFPGTADIIIPSFRTSEQLAAIVSDMEGYVALDRYRTITTCEMASAATNRNIGLNRAAKGGNVIMIDDDICGFHEGWADMMVEPLLDPSVIMVSARLLNPAGGLAYSMSEQNDLTPGIVDIPSRKAPTACIAFREDGTRFDERFIHSGFEDTWFCDCLNKKYPQGRYVVNNNVRLIHKNERKGQDKSWEYNSNIYEKLRKGEMV